MKFFRLDLLTLLISLFILNSCKNQTTIGLPAGTEGLVGSSLTDTATVLTNTTTDDSIVTSGITKSPAGYLTDPVLGTTSASLVTDLNLPNAILNVAGGSYALPSGTIVIDSAILALKYADGFYGDSLTSKYTANVYQLNEPILSVNQPYYGMKQWNYNNTVVGTTSFYSRTHTNVKYDTIMAGAPDTLKIHAPQLRIPLNVNFIRQILFDAPANQLASNPLFRSAVKGLYINITPSSGAGGVFMFQAASSDSIAVYIRSTVGTTVDTSVIYMSPQTYASSIRHVYTQKVLNALNHTTPSDTTIYLQGLAGLRSKISFPYIKQLVAKLGGQDSIVINRAELVLTAAPASDIPAYLAPVPKLSLYRLDIAHQRTEIEDASIGSDPRAYAVGVFGGFYNQNTRTYNFLVTSYLQDLIRGITIDYGTYIAPIDDTNTVSVDVAATPEVASRTIGVGSTGSYIGNQKLSHHITLNIIYTKIPKK